MVIGTPQLCYCLEGALSPTVQMDVNVQNLNSNSELQMSLFSLTLCRPNLQLYCMGRKAAFFQQAFKFTYYTRNRSPLQEKKIITIKLEKTE